MTPTDVSDLISAFAVLGVFGIISGTILAVVMLGNRYGWYDDHDQRYRR